MDLLIIVACLLSLAAASLLWSALRLMARTGDDPDYRKLGEASLRHEHDRANVGAAQPGVRPGSRRS